MKKIKNKLELVWVFTFILLWFLVSAVSTIHSVKFFELSNNLTLSWVLAISFEVGAMASLGGLVLSKGNKTLVWILFIVLTLFQIHGNMYWSWVNAKDISQWSDLFDLSNEDENLKLRIFTFISGGVLPLVSLGFIKSLMDYMNKDKSTTQEKTNNKENKISDINTLLKNSSNDLKKYQ